MIDDAAHDPPHRGTHRPTTCADLASPARRAARDEPADTSQRLLDAARRAFAAKGFDAASVREITAAAGANLAAVTYHFGSKDALYEAVLETVLADVGGRIRAAAEGASGGAPLERIEAILRAQFAAIAAHPDFQILVMQQVVARHRLPAAALRHLPEAFAVLASAIRDGQAEGSIRSGDPLLMAISVVSQPAYFGVVARLLLPRLAPGSAPPATWDGIEEHAVAFVRAALAAPGEEP
jgi:AcrR family transcriptional regulator